MAEGGSVDPRAVNLNPGMPRYLGEAVTSRKECFPATQWQALRSAVHGDRERVFRRGLASNRCE